jgi:hypothetical protein
MKIRLVAAALVAALAPVLAHAQDAASPVAVHPLIGFMGTFGGDKLVDVLFTDGTSSAVTAGGTVYLYGGAELRTTDLPVPLSVKATVGYHVGSAGGSNGDYRFERIPFELLGEVDVIPSRLRLGGGVRYDTGVNLSSHGVVAAPATKFQNATGGVIQAEWMLGPNFSIVGRYVGIRYRFDDSSTGKQYRANGNQGGIGINWYL